MEKKDLIFLVSYAFIVLTSFSTQDIYSATTKYGTLIIFITLCGFGFLWAKSELLPSKGLLLSRFMKRASSGSDAPPALSPGLKKDLQELLITAAASLIAGVNLLILHSNKGAWLTATDIALMLFLIPRIRLHERVLQGCMLIGAIMMLPWYSFVRWDYNFNMAGLCFLTFMVTGEIFLDYMRLELNLGYMKYVQVLLFFTTLLFTICYHARGAIVCVLIYGILVLNVQRIVNSRVLGTFLNLCVTIGSLIFTITYAIMGNKGVNLTILYKKLISGRERIWSELWDAFLRSPITGIGSSYNIRSFFIFEVHNGLFDILAVHGILVFLLIFFLLYRRLNELCKTNLRFYPDKRLAFAGVYTYLFASFYENCFIVPPYNMIFLTLMLICCK